MNKKVRLALIFVLWAIIGTIILYVVPHPPTPWYGYVIFYTAIAIVFVMEFQRLKKQKVSKNGCL